jgi:hypothetical protein
MSPHSVGAAASASASITPESFFVPESIPLASPAVSAAESGLESVVESGDPPSSPLASELASPPPLGCEKSPRSAVHAKSEKAEARARRFEARGMLSRIVNVRRHGVNT